MSSIAIVSSRSKPASVVGSLPSAGFLEFPSEEGLGADVLVDGVIKGFDTSSDDAKPAWLMTGYGVTPNATSGTGMLVPIQLGGEGVSYNEGPSCRRRDRCLKDLIL